MTTERDGLKENRTSFEKQKERKLFETRIDKDRQRVEHKKNERKLKKF
ncbi:hypothetical protein ACQKTA_07335 [Enterococcus sp. 22-H-5-01]